MRSPDPGDARPAVGKLFEMVQHLEVRAWLEGLEAGPVAQPDTERQLFHDRAAPPVAQAPRGGNDQARRVKRAT